MTNNLSTFRLLFLVKGILTLLFSLFFLAYAAMGTIFSKIPEFNDDPAMPFNPGILFFIVGGIGFILTAVMGIITLMASKYIKETRKYDFIFVVSILNGVTGILGILLAVFTIIELMKPNVKALFGKT